jgi:murein DD-endopeptidase MepM/ murein hydrolase activator NlpD
MKTTLTVLLFLCTSVAFSQSATYQQALEDFKTYFNAQDDQAVFDMMDQNMQNKLGFENVSAIVKTFHSNLGSIISYNYLKTEGTTEFYEAQFENGNQIITLSLDENLRLNGLRFLPAEEKSVIAKLDRNKTGFSLPFMGEWFTVWGGDTKAQNYHVISKTQKNAFDFLIIGKNGRSYERSGTRNEDYYAFGQPLYAVCDAEVIEVITGVEDNKPGEMNPMQALGNSVTLRTSYEEYIVYAHFEKETIKVKEGQFVKKGQYLGNAGNSGNSTEAHLHFHVQDGPKHMTSVGVKCYFESLMVNGELQLDYSPIRLDRIAPAQE